MSQFDFGVIDPNSKSGPQLALDLNEFRDALNSGHRGASRPAYAKAGMTWVREVSSAQWDLVLFDGDTDFVIRSINPTTNALINIPSAQVKGLDTALAMSIKKDTVLASGAAILPAGTSAQRPGVPSNGMIRHNSDAGEMERYQGGKWLALNVLDKALNEAPIVTLASASTLNIGAAAANTLTVSGTITITAFDTVAVGAVRRLLFSGALTLTHSASIVLPGAANIVTSGGDVAEFVSLGAGKWKCLSFTRAADRPNGKGQCTAWVNFDGTGTVAIRDSYNVLSITDRGVGRYTINFEQDMANINYSVGALSGLVGTSRTVVTPFANDPAASAEAPLVSSFKIAVGEVGSGAAADASRISLQVFGGK